jgi:hypothetical protein
MLSIAEIKSWWKRCETDVLIAVAFVLASTAAFLAGRISVLSQSNNPVVISVPESVTTAENNMASSMPDLVGLAMPGGGNTSASSQAGIPAAERKGEYVASKNGKYFYTADMYMATRIKAQNRVWFSSRAEAEARGFEPYKDLAK